MADRTDIHVQREETIIIPSDVEARGADRGADPEAIRAEIRETRERMSHTLDDISERLNPDVLKDQVKHKVREATIGRAEDMARHAADRVTETRHSIMDTLRDNPVPAAMVGIGLGWLVWNGRKEESHRTAHVEYDVRYRGYDRGYGPRRMYYEEPGLAERASGRASEMGSEVRDRASEMGSEVRDRASEVGDRASDLADTARDRAQDLAHHASDTVSDFADRTREAASDATDRARSAARQLARRTRRGTHRVEDRYEENPLGLGALAVALGFAAGLSAPTTRQEVELMGDARDELVGRVRDKASDTAEKAQRVAERVADEVGSTAKETAQQTAKQEGLTSSQGGSSQGGSSGSSQGGSSGSSQGGTTGQGTSSGGTGVGSVPGGTALGDTHTRPGGI